MAEDEIRTAAQHFVQPAGLESQGVSVVPSAEHRLAPFPGQENVSQAAPMHWTSQEQASRQLMS
jgi:hypothetical protein